MRSAEPSRCVLALALLLAACGGEREAAGAGDEQSAARAPIMVHNEAVNETAIDSEAVSRGTAVEGKSPSPAPVPAPAADRYRAIGTEPFWAVTVKGSTATLERPDRLPMRLPVVREDDARAIRYLGDGFSMVVTEGPCSDGMSDAVWSDRVSLAFGEGTLKGCGGVRDDGGAEQR